MKRWQPPVGTELRSVATRYLPLLILLALWQLCSGMGWLSPLVVPSPMAITTALADMAGRGELGKHALASFSRAAAGLGLAILIGTACGVAMGVSRKAYLLINPFLQAIYPVPKAALIPVVLILFGLGSASKIFLIALGCSLPVAISAYNGTRGVDRFLLWSSRSLGATPRDIITVRFLAALPELMNGLRTALAMAFVLLVSSEMLISVNGLGFLIGNLGENGNYPAMFGIIMLVAASGFLADRIFLLITKWVLRWQHP